MILENKRTGKLLIISSDENTSKEISSLLEISGYTSEEAVSISNAVDILKNEPGLSTIKLIICDLKEIYNHGGETTNLEKIHSLGIPVILIMGSEDINKTGPLLKKNIKDFILKPIDREVLLRAVENNITPFKDFDY
ncbi:MAG: response regulator [Nitrospinales bacterium]